MTNKPLPVSIPVSIARPQSVVGADAMLIDVKKGIQGINDRISGLDLQTTPAAFIGPTPAFTFQPESTAFALDVAQANGATSLVNYIIRSGVQYQLPIIVGGNGLFLCTKFRIVIWQRFNVNPSNLTNIGATPANIAYGTVAPMVNCFYPDFAVFWTTKFSCFPKQPLDQNPSINYRWNIQDPVSGYNYSDQLIPASAILNRQNVGSNDTAVQLPDGDWHEFDVPWRIEKAEQRNVIFRPLTDIVQFDSSISGTNGAIGLPYDDRIGGLRNQAVTVQVEFQGERLGGR